MADRKWKQTDEFNPYMLKLLRQKTGLSQAKFAKLVGLPRPSITNYEAGKRVPTRRNVARIALACDVPLVSLYLRQVDDDAA